MQFLLRDSMVWVCTQSSGRMNMLISSSLRLHTQITINCACNFSRLFVLKISTKLCIQCSVMHEYKRGICSNISKKEYLCVQIWCNSIIWCAHFSNLDTEIQKPYHIEGGNEMLERQATEPVTYVFQLFGTSHQQAFSNPLVWIKSWITVENK